MILLLFFCQLTVEVDKSSFAVITHKAGLASGLAHNHLIMAHENEVQITNRPGEEGFEVTFKTKTINLTVDDPAQQKAMWPLIQRLNLLNETFEELSEKDRKKIRKSMLHKSQLNADHFPVILARATEFKTEKVAGSLASLNHKLKLEMTIVGKKITRDVACQWDAESQTILVMAELKFSDFGIKPYSAMLGAVKNQDKIHLLVQATLKE